MHELGLQGLHPRFVSPLLGQVSHEGREQVMIANLRFADLEIDGKQRAVLAPRGDGAADTDDLGAVGLEIVGDVLVVIVPVGRTHKQADILAKHVSSVIAEQLLGSLAERGDEADIIDDDHGIRHRSKDRAEVLVEGINVHLRHVEYLVPLRQRALHPFPIGRIGACSAGRSIR